MIKDERMIDAMDTFGGSFVKSLANAMMHADSINYLKLIDAFPEYVRQYVDMAKKMP